MKLRSTIFDSNSERKAFTSLQSRWSSKLTLYPQLPLSKMIEISPSDLTEKEKDFYYKTNVDYTFCQKDNRPILSIEFDGIGGGFSKDGKYIQAKATPDPNRKKKMDFKLRLAQSVSYPFIVVSYEESDFISETESYTILDGIVGQFLSKLETEKILEKWWTENKHWVGELPQWEQQELIQDQVISAEVEAEFLHDPIFSEASKYEHLCDEYMRREMKNSQFGLEHKVTHLNDPPLPELKGPDIFGDLDGIIARAEAMQNTIREGCRIIIEVPKITIVNTVWVRNFTVFGVYPYFIAENISKYLAFKKAYRILKDNLENWGQIFIIDKPRRLPAVFAQWPGP